MARGARSFKAPHGAHPRYEGAAPEGRMKSLQHHVTNRDGWLLALTQTWDPARLVPGRRPVLIVPGYGMNSHIFSFHPRGVSLEGFLAERGFEVWRVDLRGSGDCIRRGGRADFSLEDLALRDLPAAIDAALDRSRTHASRADVIGASLGGTLSVVHACVQPDHRIGSLVLMGSPVRWVAVHPLVRWMFASPALVGLVRVRGTRRLAERALPVLARHTPWLLSIYMNPEASDVGAADEMVKTVEDPNRLVNRQIAAWIKRGDLVVEGVNVSEALAGFRRPLLCLAANGDGIVPLDTARFPFDRAGGSEKRLCVVGSRELALAHADLFVANEAHELVFRPIAEWLGDEGRQAVA
jgi:pimeloyl-ACP methyl ester carboxylesterase